MNKNICYYFFNESETQQSHSTYYKNICYTLFNEFETTITYKVLF